MYIVDTSIWINLLGKKPKFSLDVDHLFQLAVSPPIVQELLQGLQSGPNFGTLRSSILALPCHPETVTLEDYLAAADIYRSGRRRGLTIRSSLDCLIAALAINQNLPVWHMDRDFESIARFTNLEETQNPW